MNSKVDEYIANEKKWQEEYKALRAVVLECELKEEVKWGVPCYTYNGKNVIIIHGFKEYFALLFFKGSLLKDPHDILKQQTDKVQGARQIRLNSVEKIKEMKPILIEYINAAIEVEKAGLEVPMKPHSEYIVPLVLQKKFDEIPNLKAAFESLTPGRQRAYMFYFDQPKKIQTKEERVEKYLKKILDGKGMYD